MSQKSTIDSTCKVSQIVAEFPAAEAVLNRLGIDTCCGGGVSLDEAVRRHGLDREAVLEALGAAVPSGTAA